MAVNCPARASLSRLYRLQRALSETLDELLVNPKGVGEQYGVKLSDEEITAVRNASHFGANWDFLCGEGQWLDAALPNGRAPTSSTFNSEIVARCVRTRSAEEILRDTPEPHASSPQERCRAGTPGARSLPAAGSSAAKREAAQRAESESTRDGEVPRGARPSR